MANASKSSVSRKFRQSEPLRLALLRSKIEQSGATATLILEAFLEDGGRILASKVVARGLCKEGEFSPWRKRLMDKGWLVWSEAQQDKGLYFAGKKLLPYLNKEITLREEIATRASLEKIDRKLTDQKADRSELQATQMELSSTKSKLEETSSKLEETNRLVAKIAKAVRKLQMAKEPPITEEKLCLQRQAEDELEIHTRSLTH